MKKNLKLGIFSDSHTKTKMHQEVVSHLLEMGAEHLIHAGDIMLEEHLQILEDAPHKLQHDFKWLKDKMLKALVEQWNVFKKKL